MAQYGDQHGRRAEEYGDPTRQTEEYGDPVHRPTGVDYGTTGAGGTYGTTGTTAGTQQVTSPQVTSATLGAIRAEPYEATGTHPTVAQGTTAASTGAAAVAPPQGEHGGRHQKKGMMEKIKEKLPGHQHNKST